jgi:hypothetical protein
MITEDIIKLCKQIEAITIKYSEENELNFYVARERLNDVVGLMTNEGLRINYLDVVGKLEEVLALLNADKNLV